MLLIFCWLVVFALLLAVFPAQHRPLIIFFATSLFQRPAGRVEPHIPLVFLSDPDIDILMKQIPKDVVKLFLSLGSVKLYVHIFTALCAFTTQLFVKFIFINLFHNHHFILSLSKNYFCLYHATIPITIKYKIPPT